jgi:hypothetical protein
MPSYLLSSDDLNNNVDDPNTIGRVLEYVLDNEACQALRVDQTSMGTPGLTNSGTCKRSLRTGPLYLMNEDRRTRFRTETS